MGAPMMYTWSRAHPNAAEMISTAREMMFSFFHTKNGCACMDETKKNLSDLSPDEPTLSFSASRL